MQSERRRAIEERVSYAPRRDCRYEMHNKYETDDNAHQPHNQTVVGKDIMMNDIIVKDWNKDKPSSQPQLL